MATQHKTFADGDILLAAEVNNALNPTTADHIPWAVAAGSGSLSLDAQASNTVAVTFPSGRFSAAPVVVVSAESSGGGAQNLQWFGRDATTTGFNVAAITYNAATTTMTQTFKWIAVQMTPTSGNG